MGRTVMVRNIVASVLLLSAFTGFTEEVRWAPPPNDFTSASPSIPKGTITRSLEYSCRYQKRKFSIYTPPGYSKTRAEKYPVLYLHHGIGGNEVAWSGQGSNEGNADRIMDYLYAQDNLDVVPMIVVMPMGNMEGTSPDAWQNFEAVLIEDLAPYIEANYNGSSDPNMRAIAGLSMGGGQTLNFGYKNPHFFTWIGSFSPAPNTKAAQTTITDMDAVKNNVHLNYIAVGTSEDAIFQNQARNYHNYLNQNGVSPLYLQWEQGLGHERNNWNRQLYHFAQRLFKGITPTVKPELARISQTRTSPLTIQRRIMLGSGNSYRGMQIFREEADNAVTRIFSLDGRTAGTVYRISQEQR